MTYVSKGFLFTCFFYNFIGTGIYLQTQQKQKIHRYDGYKKIEFIKKGCFLGKKKNMQKYKKIDIYCIGVEIQMMQGWAVKKER